MATLFTLMAAANELFAATSVEAPRAAEQRPHAASLFDVDSDDEIDDEGADCCAGERAGRGCCSLSSRSWRSVEEVAQAITALCPATVAPCGAGGAQQYPFLLSAMPTEADMPLSALAQLQLSLCMDTVLDAQRDRQQRAAVAEATRDITPLPHAGGAPEFEPPLFWCGVVNFVGIAEDGTKLYRSPLTGVSQPVVPPPRASCETPDAALDAALDAVRAVPPHLVRRHVSEHLDAARRLELRCGEQFRAFAAAYYGCGSASAGGATTRVCSAYVRDRSSELSGSGSGGAAGVGEGGARAVGGGDGSARCSGGANMESATTDAVQRVGLEVVVVIAATHTVAGPASVGGDGGDGGVNHEWRVAHSFFLELTRGALKVAQRSRAIVALPRLASAATGSSPLRVIATTEFATRASVALAGPVGAGGVRLPRPVAGDAMGPSSGLPGSPAESAGSADDPHSVQQIVEAVGSAVQASENASIYPALIDVSLKPALERLLALRAPCGADSDAASGVETLHPATSAREQLAANAEAARALVAAVREGKRRALGVSQVS